MLFGQQEESLGQVQSPGRCFVVATEGVVGAGHWPLLGQEFSWQTQCYNYPVLA